MSTSVTEGFAAAGLEQSGVVTWGIVPPVTGPGVYIIAVPNSSQSQAAMEHPPLAGDAFEAWLERCPELTLFGRSPTKEELMIRIGGFWLPDESIVYVGLASSLASRLRQYYSTPIGASRPHSGGYFLKLLSNLSQLHVHFAETKNTAQAENCILRHFATNVSRKSKETLIDPENPLPFANLEWPRGTRKNHGLRGAREARTVPREKSVQATHPGHNSVATLRIGNCLTQRVTAGDIDRGQIRIPSTSTQDTKRLFPATKSALTAVVRGRKIDCHWNPRMGPDRQRSGLLRVGSSLRGLVREDEILSASRIDGSLIVIQ